MRIMLLLTVLVMNWMTLHAEWDPEITLMDSDISILENPYLKELKRKVTDYLENTWCSKEKINLLMDLVAVTHPSVCVEIGAFSGSSVLPVAATLKFLRHGKIYAIDGWSNEVVTKNLDLDDPNREWWSKVDMLHAFKTFQHTLAHWNLQHYCILIRKPSNVAVQQLPEIDFLHIDGDYSEKGTLEDVELYLPKVKSGGYILFSNVFTRVKDKSPKLVALPILTDACEIVAEIENDHALLLQKR